MIKGEHITKSFEGRTVLDDVSVQFDKGKTNLIIGRSGSGKTVMMKCLVGLVGLDDGDIWYNDVCFSRLDFQQLKAIRQEMGMIFQGGALLDSSTVEENVRLPLDLFTDRTEAEKRDRVDFCLERVALSGVNHLYPSELSGGMIKRVAIARAIVMNPKYLFCDEPNSGLDPITSGVIDRLIAEITREYKITTVINTHDMNSVLEIGQKVVFLHEGRKWWEGTRHDIMHANNPELEDFVFASAMAKRTRKTTSRRSEKHPEAVMQQLF
ncbi:MAG: ATP-binding cassette domain-containing protein [Alistipes sp.]|jgi:phospholipid/cholesterol/gamma-HCH transport system ATP-binding protein|nr:ATP-binding cassette domain-containing protein [Alistipes sp.]